MAHDEAQSAPLTRDRLVGWFEDGRKPADALRIGMEHEKIPFYRDGLSPVPYEAGRGGIRDMLEGFAAGGAWRREHEGGQLNALTSEDGRSISLEPGGQFELSGAPLRTIHEINAEVTGHVADLEAVADPLGIGILGLGFSPKWTLAETPAMPKQRYRIMERYMPKVGTRGLDMMFRTATAQANLDFIDEADMVRKLRVSLALQPVATALFANSPFTEGAPNGFLSARSAVWLDTDRARCGMMPFAFETGMGFERYVDYALDVPMYLVKRDERMHDVTGQSFRAFMEGRLEALPGDRATMADWGNHLTTVFTEVRLKRYLEMRGEDVGAPEMTVALGALFAGLLYDATALDAASELVKPWTAQERQRMRDEVPTRGFATVVEGRSLRDVARVVVDIAKGGLKRRAMADAQGNDETRYLGPLEAIVDRGVSPAEVLLARFRDEWRGSVDPVFEACAYF